MAKLNLKLAPLCRQAHRVCALKFIVKNGRNLGMKSRRPAFRRAFMGRKASGPMRGWPSKPFYNPEFMGACRCESRKKTGPFPQD